MVNSELDEHQRGGSRDNLATEAGQEAPRSVMANMAGKAFAFSRAMPLNMLSCLGKCFPHLFHILQFVTATVLIFTCWATVSTSRLQFEVEVSKISNLMIDSEVNALRFWCGINEFGIEVIKYHGRLGVKHTSDYSSTDLSGYDCGVDAECGDTVDNLSAAWTTLLMATALTALVGAVGWLLAAPRNFYPCFYNTRLCERGVRLKKAVIMCLVKPFSLTFVLVVMYMLVALVQLIAFSKFLHQLPTKRQLRALSLHYLNSDPSLCSVMAPCDYSNASVHNYSQNTFFFFAGCVVAATTSLCIRVAHYFDLQSIRWPCFIGCCAGSEHTVCHEQETSAPQASGQEASAPQTSAPQRPRHSRARSQRISRSLDRSTLSIPSAPPLPKAVCVMAQPVGVEMVVVSLDDGDLDSYV